MTEPVGRNPPPELGKTPETTPSSQGSLLNKAISSFLNFTWPVFGKMVFHEATFVDYAEKNKIASTLAQSLPGAKTLLRNLSLKELKTLDNGSILTLLKKAPPEKLSNNIWLLQRILEELKKR